MDFFNSVLWLFIIFACGILFAYVNHKNPDINNLFASIYILLAIFCADILFIFGRKIYQTRFNKKLKFSNMLENISDGLKIISIIITVFNLGVLRMNARTYFLNTQMINAKINNATVSGILYEVEYFPNKYRVVIKDVKSSQLAPDIHKLILNISIDEFEKSGIKIGDWFTFMANLNPLSVPVFIGDFDYQRYSYYRGISGGGQIEKIIFVDKDIENKSIFLDGQFLNRVKNFRYDMGKYISENMSESSGTVALTLITGERHAVNKNIQNNYKKSGVSHLLAISGFHMTVIAGIVFLVVRFLLVLVYPISSKYDVKNFAYIITLAALTGYLLLSGARLSTQRAYIMAVAGLAAIIMGKSPVSIRLLLIAGLIILMMTPEAILNAGFGLSFMAVMTLITVFKMPRVVNFGYKLKRKSFIYHTLFYSFLTAAVASFATSVLTLYNFNEYPVWSIITNMMTTPIFVLMVMPTVVAFLIFNNLLPFFGIGDLLLNLLDFNIGLINYITDFMADMPCKTIFVNYMQSWVVGLFVVGFLMFVLLKNRYKIVGLIIAVSSLFFIRYSGSPDLIINKDGDVFITLSRWRVIGFNVLRDTKSGDGFIQNYYGDKESFRKRIVIAKRIGISIKNLNFIKYSSNDEFYFNNISVYFQSKVVNGQEIVCWYITKWNLQKEYCLTNKNIAEIYFYPQDFKIKME